jgi:hypothetical protein
MSERDERSGRVAEQEREEPFLARWARLKRESHQPSPGSGDALEEAPAQPVRTEAAPAEEDAVTSSEAGEEDVAAPELPPLESLTEESDFAPFLKAGVDPQLRREALRKMWRNPKYNIIDELDPYRADYKSFIALGDIITSDMKYHAARLLREQLEKAAQAGEVEETAPEESAGAEPAAAEGGRRAAVPGDAVADDGTGAREGADEATSPIGEDGNERRDS